MQDFFRDLHSLTPIINTCNFAETHTSSDHTQFFCQNVST